MADFIGLSTGWQGCLHASQGLVAEAWPTNPEM
jgi:hypothetical protein